MVVILFLGDFPENNKPWLLGKKRKYDKESRFLLLETKNLEVTIKPKKY